MYKGINKFKKYVSISIFFVIAVFLIFLLSGCSNKLKDKSSMDVSIASEPETIDPALVKTSDAGTMVGNIFSGLAKWSKTESGDSVVVPDVAQELTEPVKNADGTCTYTYKLKDTKWSDGKAVRAQDFVFAWNRACSVELAADYSYMFEVIDGYEAMWAKDAKGDEKLNVHALDDKTLQVTTSSYYTYWDQLLAFQCFMPVREDVVDNEGMWATKPETYICNGPYKLAYWNHNSVIALTKNENFYNADSVKIPNLNFYLSDNGNNVLVNFKNGDWDMITGLPTNEIQSIKENYSKQYYVNELAGCYFFVVNKNVDLSPKDKQLSDNEQNEVRRAISLLFDRNYIVEDIVKGNQKPASSYVPSGIKDADGKEFYTNAGHSSDYIGYWPVDDDHISSNYQNALNTLYKYYDHDESGKLTNFPNLVYIYNTNEGHKAIAEYIQNVLSTVGIPITLENQEWTSFLITRKAGSFAMAREGWSADYTDPTTFLDMHASKSGNNDSQLGKGADANKSIYKMDLSSVEGYSDKSVESGTWAETYDVLIKYIKNEGNNEIRCKLMHIAEDMLMETGCVCPLYYNTNVYLLQDNIGGFYTNPLNQYFYFECYYKD